MKSILAICLLLHGIFLTQGNLSPEDLEEEQEETEEMLV